MNMKKSILLLGMILVFTACSSGSSDNYYTDSDGQSGEVGNPYTDDSGHSAGYEWAERTGGGCSGNSASFNEGCEEYYGQIGQ